MDENEKNKAAKNDAETVEKVVEKQTENDSSPQKKPPDEKTFTQKELDEIVSERLKRERKMADKVAEKASGETEKIAKENAELKNSLACYKAGVREDCIEDAVILAERLVDDKTDFGTALIKVLEKHPSFVSGGAVTTGVRTENKSYSQSDEKLRAAFGLKQKT